MGQHLRIELSFNSSLKVIFASTILAGESFWIVATDTLKSSYKMEIAECFPCSLARIPFLPHSNNAPFLSHPYTYFYHHNLIVVVAEVIQIGRVPVYLYDDHPWLPYEGTELAFSTYGLSGKMGHLGGLAKELKQLSNETFSAKLQKVKEVREHYTYAGLLRQIEKFLGDPLGPNGGHLRCTRVPDKDH
jgi:hypothetical protein